jgi:hypothetical protein
MNNKERLIKSLNDLVKREVILSYDISNLEKNNEITVKLLPIISTFIVNLEMGSIIHD